MVFLTIQSLLKHKYFGQTIVAFERVESLLEGKLGYHSYDNCFCCCLLFKLSISHVDLFRCWLLIRLVVIVVYCRFPWLSMRFNVPVVGFSPKQRCYCDLFQSPKRFQGIYAESPFHPPIIHPVSADMVLELLRL